MFTARTHRAGSSNSILIRSFTKELGPVARPSLLVLLLWLGFLVYNYSSRSLFPFDDTFITFRYAYNLAHGYGLVWNPGGPHTEGYTNFLFVVLLAPFSWITTELVPIAQWISIVATLFTGLAIADLARSLTLERFGKRSFYAGLAAVLLYFSESNTWFNAFSGMETSLFVMWVLLALVAFSRVQPLADEFDAEALRTRQLRVAYILAFLATLTRPEGGLLAVGFLLFSFLRASNARNAWRTVLPFLTAFLLPLAVYLGWKYWYFGDLLPNSFYVKHAQQANAMSADSFGNHQLPLYFAAARYLLVLAGLGLVATIRSRVSAVITLWIAGLTVFYWDSALLQPFYYRFFYSMEALLIVLSGVGLYAFFRFFRFPLVRWFALVAVLIYHTGHTYAMRGGEKWLNRSSEYDDRWKEVAEIFRSLPKHEKLSFAWSDVGILSYYSGMQNIDLVGLNTTAIAKATSPEEVRSILLRSQPDFIFVPVDHTVTPGDSCRHIVSWGHGYIGRIYPTISHDTAFSNYHPIIFFRHEAYEILIMTRRLDGISRVLQSSFAHEAYNLPLPNCFR